MAIHEHGYKKNLFFKLKTLLSAEVRLKYFNEKIRGVLDDKKTGLVTLTIQWKDPKVAAQWANLIVSRLNDSMRERALAEAQTNVAFLQHELESVSVVTLQQSIGRLLDSELQKLMIARGKREFAYRVIDRAQVPKWHAKPKRAAIVVLSTVLGVVLSILVLIMRGAIIRPRRAAPHAN